MRYAKACTLQLFLSDAGGRSVLAWHGPPPEDAGDRVFALKRGIELLRKELRRLETKPKESPRGSR